MLSAFLKRWLLGPDEATQQHARIKRYLRTSSNYFAALIPIAFAAAVGVSATFVLQLYAALIIGANLFFYCAFRTGLNLRFKDRSLSLMQTIVAIGIVLICQIFAGSARSFWVLSLMMIFVFGGFKLSGRALRMLTFTTLLAYALTIPLARIVDGTAYRLEYELLLWLNFAFFLPALSWTAGEFGRLRRQLANSNAELQVLFAEVSHAASHDSLTGVYNRRFILEALRGRLVEAKTRGLSCCVCLFDLDGFKQINDLCGHDGGDIVIQAFARTATNDLQPDDVFARYGGEEFLLLMPNATLKAAQDQAERIRQAFERQRHQIEAHDIATTVSAGIAELRPDESAVDLVRRADQALYRAKALGRNRIEFG